MSDRTDRRRMTAPMRVAVTSLLVASGVGLVGVAPAMAANHAPPQAAFGAGHESDRDRWLHDHWFRDRGDFRYRWFRVCDGTAAGAGATTTTTATGTTTDPEAVGQDALAAAVEGASVDTTTTTENATDTPTTTGPATTGTTTTDTTTVDGNTPDSKAYPAFIVVPMPKDEAIALQKLDERPCFDLATGAPRTADTTTTNATPTTTTTTTDVPPAVETTTTTPVATGTGG